MHNSEEAARVASRSAIVQGSLLFISKIPSVDSRGPRVVAAVRAKIALHLDAYRLRLTANQGAASATSGSSGSTPSRSSLLLQLLQFLQFLQPLPLIPHRQRYYQQYIQYTFFWK